MEMVLYSRNLIHESGIRECYRTRLPSASLDEVRYLSDRFLDWEVCRFAVVDFTCSLRTRAAAQGMNGSL